MQPERHECGLTRIGAIDPCTDDTTGARKTNGLVYVGNAGVIWPFVMGIVLWMARRAWNRRQSRSGAEREVPPPAPPTRTQRCTGATAGAPHRIPIDLEHFRDDRNR